jgi:hypothetical protein
VGTITDDLMRNPDMWDLDGEPCLLVVKSGNATGTTIGSATGVFSIVREYFRDMSVNQTSMVGDNQPRRQVGSLFGTWRFRLSDLCHAVLVAPRAYQGQRVPQRAPQRRCLGISTSKAGFFPRVLLFLLRSFIH